ncbi:ABC transporter permease [candidate division KSB1 bacterium]
MNIFKINANLSRKTAHLLSALLFIISIGLYIEVARVRHQNNPSESLTPTISQMIDGFNRQAFEKDKRTGEYELLVDTIASARRFLISLAILFLAVILGLHMGIQPYIESVFLRFITFFDKISPIALVPILFIVFGLGDASKVALIVIAVFPVICLDTYLRAKAVHSEQIIKGKTLAATDLEVTYRIVLPQIFPQVLDTIRLNFKSMILLLLASEMLGANAGLGYRIFLVRKFTAFDVIIPYVIWISVLAYTLDFLFRLWIRKRYSWSINN